MNTRSEQRGRRVTGRLWVFLAGLSFFIALIGSLWLRQLPIEISLDLNQPAGQVGATWPGGETVLSKLDDAWSPHHYTVQITAPDNGNAAPGGYQVIAMCSMDRVTYSDPSLWGKASTYFMLFGDKRPATLELEGWTIGPNPYLTFETDPVSEDVDIASGGNAPEHFSLHSEQRGNFRYPIKTDQRRYRYTGQVPRSQLNNISITVTDLTQPAVERLYINSALPRIFYPAEPPVNAPAGIRTANWKPIWSENHFDLPRTRILGCQFVPTLLFLWSSVFASLLLVVLILRGVVHSIRALWRSESFARLEGPLPRKLVAAFWLPAFLVWCFFLLNFYPGTMNADSLTQWSEIQTFKFTPIHPPIYALLMWLGTFLWDSPATTAFFQILAASFVVALAFALLWKTGIPRILVLILYAVTVLSPRNNTTLISLLKDTPYSIAMLGLAVCLTWFLLQPQRRVVVRWACAGLCLGAAAVFRHNGPLVALALIPLLLLYFPRQWRAWAALVVAFLSIFLGVKEIVYPRISIDAGDGGFHDLTTCHLAILLDRDIPLRTDEYEFLNQVREVQDRWAYDPRRVGATAQPLKEFSHRAWAKAHSAPYLSVYKQIITRNPLNAAMYLVERGEFLYVPWQTDVEMETYFLGISRNDMGLWTSEFFLDWPQQLREGLAWTARPSVNWIFWRPALPLYIVIIACFVLCLRQRSIAWSIVYLPFLLNTGTIALAAISQACRYQFPLTFAAAFLVGLAFLPRATRTIVDEAAPVK